MQPAVIGLSQAGVGTEKPNLFCFIKEGGIEAKNSRIFLFEQKEVFLSFLTIARVLLNTNSQFLKSDSWLQ